MPLVQTTEAERKKASSLLGLRLDLQQTKQKKLLEEEWKYPHEFELFERGRKDDRRQKN
jgi:hypothetical protein